MAEADLPQFARSLLEHLPESEAQARYSKAISELPHLGLDNPIIGLDDTFTDDLNESSNHPRNTNVGVQTDPGVEATTNLHKMESKTKNFCSQMRTLLKRFFFSYREDARRNLTEQHFLGMAENLKLEYIAEFSKDKSKQKKQSEDCASEASSSSVMEDSYALSKIAEIENKLKDLLDSATAIRLFVHMMDTYSTSETGSDAAVCDSIASETSALNLNPTTPMPADSQDETELSLPLATKSLCSVEELNPVISKGLFKPQKPNQERERSAINSNAFTWKSVDAFQNYCGAFVPDSLRIKFNNPPLKDILRPLKLKSWYDSEELPILEYKPQKLSQERTKVIELGSDSGDKNFTPETNEPPANMKPNQERERSAINSNAFTWKSVDAFQNYCGAFVPDSLRIKFNNPPLKDILRPLKLKSWYDSEELPILEYKPQKLSQERTKVIELGSDSGDKNFTPETNEPPANMKPNQERERSAINSNAFTWKSVDSQDQTADVGDDAQTEVDAFQDYCGAFVPDSLRIKCKNPPLKDILRPLKLEGWPDSEELPILEFKPQKLSQERTKVIELVCDSGEKNFTPETNEPPANMAYMDKCSKQESASGSSQTKNQGAVPKKTNQNVP